jgi:transposase-like protein
MTTKAAPKTLLEAVNYFSNKEIALHFVAELRWPDGVSCPRCESKSVSFLKTRQLWKCKGCAKQFSAKVGTIFEDSPIGLEKWLPAMWMVVNCKNGISSYELGRALGVTQKTAWFMLHRLRLAMQSKSFRRMSGEVEVDETFIGGRARFMHKDRREKLGPSGKIGSVGKAAVQGLLERHGEKGHSEVRAEVIDTTRGWRLKSNVRKHVKMNREDSFIYTDEWPAYEGLEQFYTHKVINHAETYVDGQVHTNGIENFWSLLKRCLRGTYVSVEPFHLFRYLDEQAFRFNNRKGTDLSRFVDAMKTIVGRRVTYDVLTGHVEAPAI